MYGMVNKAVEELVCTQFGQDQWDAIKTKAGVEEDVFISNEPYPDSLTYKLVGAASEVLGIEAAKILEAFGEHWVLKTAEEGYGVLMAAGGKTFPEFLQNLPQFHARIMLLFPKLQPPEFKVFDVQNASLRLLYYSHRAGLEPFVVGLLKGLGKRFQSPVTVSHVSGVAGTGSPAEFLVEWATSSEV